MESIPPSASGREGAFARALAAYVGGKRNLAGRLVRLIEDTPHDLYAEAFVGMGGVFLRRRTIAPIEVINDWSADIATLFRVLQHHYLAFVEYIRWQVTARVEFDRLMAANPDTLTDIQRAARFLYLQRSAFGGKVAGRNFAIRRDAAHGKSFDVTRLVPLLEDVHARLAGVAIERLPFDHFIRSYDRAGALFYLDPPYLGSEQMYGRGDGMFGPDDHARLREVLAGAKGRWILSINDHPDIRALYEGCAIEAVGVSYGLAASGATAARELIITPD